MVFDCDEQKFTDINTQINILRDRGLIIENEAMAKYYLIYYGYYNIINGYKTLYVYKDMNGNEKFKENVTFEQIISLFKLDYDLRTIIYKIITDVEMHLKANLAHIIAKYHTHKFENYVNPMCYKNSNPSNGTYSLYNVLEELKVAYNFNKDPIKHNRIEHGNVPPWVLFKGVYFSTVINLVRYLKGNEKDDLVQMYYNISSSKYNALSNDDKQLIKKNFLNSLLLLKKFRNYCSHCGRIYNLIGLKQLRKNEIIKMTNIIDKKVKIYEPKTGIDELILALYPMRNDYVLNLRKQFKESLRKYYSNNDCDRKMIVSAVGKMIKI